MISKYTANQDVRDYMEDRGVSQRMLAESMNTNQTKVSKMLRTELPQKEKEIILRHIDAIAEDNEPAADEAEMGGAGGLHRGV